MKIVPDWNVFSAWPCLEPLLDMGKEPRLMPSPNLIQLLRMTRLNHISSHDNCLIFAINQAFHKLVVNLLACFPFKHLEPDWIFQCKIKLALLHDQKSTKQVYLNSFISCVSRIVVQLDEPFARYYLDFNRDKKSQGSIGPRNGIEQVSIVIS